MRRVAFVAGLLLLAGAVGVPSAQSLAGTPAAKKPPQLRIPLPKPGDFTVAFVRVTLAAKKGKKIPANARVSPALAKGVSLPASVAVASAVRKHTKGKRAKAVFDLLVVVVNKRSGASRYLAAATAPAPIDIRPYSHAGAQMFVLGGFRGRTYVDNVLAKPEDVIEGYERAFKEAHEVAVRREASKAFLDRGQAHATSPQAYLEHLLELALEISTAGGPDMDGVFVTLGEIDPLWADSTANLGCTVHRERNPYFAHIVDIYAKGCRQPITGFTIVFPDPDANEVEFAPVVFYPPRTDLTPGCKLLANAIRAKDCPVEGFRDGHNFAAGFTGPVAPGTPFAVIVSRDKRHFQIQSLRVPPGR